MDNTKNDTWLFSDFLKRSSAKQGDLDVDIYSITNEGIFPRSKKFEKTLSKSNDKNKLIRKGNLAFGNSRKVLNWGIMEDEIGSVSSAYKVFVVDETKINPSYLKLYMTVKEPSFRNIIKPGARDNQGIDVNILMKKEIPKLFLEDQQKIVDIIYKLDNRIMINNKISEKMNQLSQALFKQWFISYEFPNEQGKPYKSDGGIFKKVDSDEIPENWEYKKLIEIADFQNGYAFYKIGYTEEGVKVVDLGNVDIYGNFIETKVDKYISEELYNQDKMAKFHILKNDLVIIMTDRKQTMDLLGKVGKITSDEKLILNQRVGRIRANEGINTNFLYTYLNSDKCLNILKSKALGSVQKYVNTGDITSQRILVPTEDVMNRFSLLINPIFELMERCSIENFKIEEIKGYILPKLVNGEIIINL